MSKSDQDIPTIKLNETHKDNLIYTLYEKLGSISSNRVNLNLHNLFLSCKIIREIIRTINKADINLNIVSSNIRETLVSLSALGYPTHLYLSNNQFSEIKSEKSGIIPNESDGSMVYFHQGTLRSGEDLEDDKDILLLGDINPGAKIKSAGNILIWGRLRGIAHAGSKGNKKSKIVALELRPLQLRIGSEIARGPEEKPQPGLAEEALIKSGKIIIQPANIRPFL